MPEDRHQRYARINLPHARTVVARVGRALDALGAFDPSGNGNATAIEAPLAALEVAVRDFDLDPPLDAAIEAADAAAVAAREVVSAIVAAGHRGERLGQHIRNLFECLGLAAEGAELSLRCGERADSPLR